MTYAQWMYVSTAYAILGPKAVAALKESQADGKEAQRPHPRPILPDGLSSLVGWLLPILGLPFVQASTKLLTVSGVFALGAVLMVGWSKRLFVTGAASPSLVARVLDGWGSWPLRAWTLSILVLAELSLIGPRAAESVLQHLVFVVGLSLMPIAVACTDEHWLSLRIPHFPRGLARWSSWFRSPAWALALVYVGLLVGHVGQLLKLHPLLLPSEWAWVVKLASPFVEAPLAAVVILGPVGLGFAAMLVVNGVGAFQLTAQLYPLLHGLLAAPILLPWYIAALLDRHARTGATLTNSLLVQLFWIFAIVYGIDEVHPEARHAVGPWLGNHALAAAVAGGLLALVIFQLERQRIQIRALAAESAASRAQG